MVYVALARRSVSTIGREFANAIRDLIVARVDGHVSGSAVETVACPSCHAQTPEQSRYCYRCGHQMVIQNVCPHCQVQLASEAKFCHACGQKLDARPKCPHCSAELISGSRFCGECGRSVTDNGASDSDK